MQSYDNISIEVLWVRSTLCVDNIEQKPIKFGNSPTTVRLLEGGQIDLLFYFHSFLNLYSNALELYRCLLTFISLEPLNSHISLSCVFSSNAFFTVDVM